MSLPPEAKVEIIMDKEPITVKWSSKFKSRIRRFKKYSKTKSC